jgi:hypothetical protein
LWVLIEDESAFGYLFSGQSLLLTDDPALLTRLQLYMLKDFDKLELSWPKVGLSQDDFYLMMECHNLMESP